MIGNEALAELFPLAERLADAAGRAALPHFRTSELDARNKTPDGGFDPVTAADDAAEQAVRAILAEERPDDGILGEEAERVAGTSGLTWVIDPIDGTRSFLAGIPTWGVLVALDDGTATRIGIVDQPHIGERFAAVIRSADAEAWLAHRGTRRALAVRACPRLEDAILLSTAVDLFGARERMAFMNVRGRTRLTRYGTDCYGYAMVAAGQADLVIEAALAAYDIAAPSALVHAAGGIVTDWQGGDCRWGGRVIAAGDRRVHEQALEVLSRVPGD